MIAVSLFLLSLGTARAQRFAIKTNLLLDGVGCPSLGFEYKLSDHTSASIIATYNPLKIGGAKWKNFTYQPEFRW